MSVHPLTTKKSTNILKTYEYDYLEDSWQVDRHNYDLVMLYVGGKLFSKVEHIKLSALCVYFKGFYSKE